MKILFLMLMLLAAGDSIFGQTRSGCFKNDALKDKHVVRFESNAGKVTGSYTIVRGYDASEEETFYFNGTRRGNVLTVDFSSGEQQSAADLKKAVFTLTARRGAEILRTSFRGARSQILYSMNFEPCEPNYAALFKSARRIVFAQGASSATVNVKLQNADDRKTFLLGARKRQAVSVEAPGCAISVYYPDKTPYEEGAGVDVLGMNLPQTGDYLFVIKPAGEPGACRATFKITN